MRVRNWNIDWPGGINGCVSPNTAWVNMINGYRTYQVTFYGDGKYAVDFPEALPKYLHKFLEKMAKESSRG